MTVLFATTSARDLGGDAQVYFGTAESRDTNYVDEEIAIPVEGSQNYFVPIPEFDPAPNEIWVHFRMKTAANMDSSAADGTFFTFKNSFGQTLAQLDVDNGDMRAEVSTTNGAYWDLAPNTVYTIDIHVVNDGTTRAIHLYVDGVLTSSASRSTTGSGITNLAFDCQDLGNFNTPSNIYISELIIDDQSTLGCRLHLERAAVDGNYTEMTGAATDLTDPDDGNALTGAADGERFSYQTLGYGGNTSGVTVRTVMMRTEGQPAIEGAGPHKFTNFLRIAGSDYYAAETDKGGGADVVGFSRFDINPATGVAWDITEIGIWEGGVRVNT